MTNQEFNANYGDIPSPMPTGIDTSDKLEALYWYCHDYHNGQASWQYRYLSQAAYQPGPMQSGLDETNYGAVLAYGAYCDTFER